MAVGLACAMGSGVVSVMLLHCKCSSLLIWQALPLMSIVFGDITKDFSEYFVPGSGVTETEFKAAVNKNS